jgi:redox-sensitive bicupin YhaK (pirin superfamily)
VREGVLAYVNSMGQVGVVRAGEFHRRTATSQLEHREANGSHADSAQVFQIGLRSSAAEVEPSHEQMRFSVADRRGGLCIVASSDARRGSLRIHQDALVYSAVLHAGQHVVHELDVGRCAWLHVVQGEVSLGDALLTTGDGAGATSERALSLTAQVDSEILLLDMGAATTGDP